MSRAPIATLDNPGPISGATFLDVHTERTADETSTITIRWTVHMAYSEIGIFSVTCKEGENLDSRFEIAEIRDRED